MFSGQSVTLSSYRPAYMSVETSRGAAIVLSVLIFWNYLVYSTVIPRLTMIIRSGITFVNRNFSLSRT